MWFSILFFAYSGYLDTKLTRCVLMTVGFFTKLPVLCDSHFYTQEILMQIDATWCEIFIMNEF